MFFVWLTCKKNFSLFISMVKLHIVPFYQLHCCQNFQSIFLLKDLTSIKLGKISLEISRLDHEHNVKVSLDSRLIKIYIYIYKKRERERDSQSPSFFPVSSPQNGFPSFLHNIVFALKNECVTIESDLTSVRFNNEAIASAVLICFI